MLAIYKKEMRSYFINPVGYVFVGVFLMISAGLCCFTTIQQSSYSTSNYFYYLIFALVVLIPLLTMRTFAEERRGKTEQLLLTAPVSITGMVAGKFLAAMTLYGGCMLASLINFFPIYAIARAEQAAADAADEYLITPIGPNTAEVAGQFIGVLLIGAVFITIGIFVSTLTENQLSAAVVTISAIILMIVLNILNQVGLTTDSNGYLDDSNRLIRPYFLRAIFDWVSVMSRYSAFQYGILEWSSVVYYLSLCFIFLFLSVRVYERRRWA